MQDSPTHNRTPWLGLFLLLFSSASLRLFPIQHGLPDNHVPDTHVVKAALGMAQDRDLIPPVGRWSTYPNLLPYVLLPCYAGQFALGRMNGEWSDPGDYAKAIKSSPERAHLLARIVLALISALAPIFVVLGLRAAGFGWGAWCGGWLSASSLLLVQLATHERPWVPLATFIALSMWPAAIHIRTGAARPLLLSGLAAALAFSTHQAGAFAVLIPAIAWASTTQSWQGAGLKERMRVGFICAGLFLVVALTIGHPYLIRHGMTPTDAVAAGSQLEGSQHLSIGGQSVVFQLSAETFQKLSKALVGYDPLLLILALIGFAAGLKRRETRPATGFALLWGLFFLTNQNDHVRYLVPLAVGLAWPAGIACESLLRKPLPRTLLLLGFCLPLAQALRLGVILRRPDTRAMAQADLLQQQGNEPIAEGVGGPHLALSRTALRRLAQLRDLRTRELHRLVVLEEGVEPESGYGLDALPLEDVFEFDPRHHASWPREKTIERLGKNANDPIMVLRAFGCDTILLADRTPLDGHPPMLMDQREATQEPGPDLSLHPGGVRPRLKPLALPPRPLASWSPGQNVSDARLPLELDFPLTELWKIERPGPLLQLYRVPR